ncbi:MAG: hypothetical protein IIZ60_04315 [Clostridia bacterium]|nr:hypothetical protein [Clostridia bacterium]
MSLIRAMIQTRRGNGYSRNKLAKVQNDRLNELVRFAKENSPLYEDFYKTIGKRFCLEDLPPVSKPELMANFDHVVTDRHVTMERIDEFCTDLDHVGRMLDGKYLVFKTSGSTGNPAVVLSDQLPQANPVSGKFKHIYRAESSFVCPIKRK